MTDGPLYTAARGVSIFVRDVGIPAAIAFFVLWQISGDLRSLTDAVRAQTYATQQMSDDLRDCIGRTHHSTPHLRLNRHLDILHRPTLTP